MQAATRSAFDEFLRMCHLFCFVPRITQTVLDDRAGEKALLDDRVNTPVPVDLRNAEIDCNRHQRNCLVLGETLGVHEERSHLAEKGPRSAHCHARRRSWDSRKRSLPAPFR